MTSSSAAGDPAVTARVERGVPIVELRGALHTGCCRRAEWALDIAFRRERPRIVVDASGVGDLGCEGLAVLTDATERAVDWHVPFAVAGLSAQSALITAAMDSRVFSRLDQAIAAVLDQHVPGERTRTELLNDIDLLLAALATNGVVDRATGMLMATYGMTADRAHRLLRDRSGSYPRALDAPTPWTK